MHFMIDTVKISEDVLRDLHARGASLDPLNFNLEEIINSGMHVGLVIQEE
jgi:hypothetical protein